ncbi:MAG: DUF4328 domain-containing protein [Pseudomonadota bacterium]
MEPATDKRKPNHFHGSYEDDFKPYENGPKSIRGLALWLKRFLITFIPLAAYELFFTAFALFHLSGYQAFYTTIATNAPWVLSVFFIISLLYRGTYIVCIFLTCRILYRAARNVHTVIPRTIKTTPHEAWFWFFVPFANFYKPFTCVVDIFQGTNRSLGLRENVSERLMPWWIIFIVSVVIGTFTIQATGVNFFYLNLIFDVASGILAIVASVMFIRIISWLSSKQEEMLTGGVAGIFD